MPKQNFSFSYSVLFCHTTKNNSTTRPKKRPSQVQTCFLFLLLLLRCVIAVLCCRLYRTICFITTCSLVFLLEHALQHAFLEHFFENFFHHLSSLLLKLNFSTATTAQTKNFAAAESATTTTTTPQKISAKVKIPGLSTSLGRLNAWLFWRHY